jgi:hypothetical protein
MGDGADRLGGGAGRQRRAERTKKKNGEKGSVVGGRWLLKALGARGGEGKRGGAARCRVGVGEGAERGGVGFGDVGRHGTDAAAPGCSDSGGQHMPHGHGGRGRDRGGRRGAMTQGPSGSGWVRGERERAGQRGVGH